MPMQVLLSVHVKSTPGWLPYFSARCYMKTEQRHNAYRSGLNKAFPPSSRWYIKCNCVPSFFLRGFNFTIGCFLRFSSSSSTIPSLSEYISSALMLLWNFCHAGNGLINTHRAPTVLFGSTVLSSNIHSFFNQIYSNVMYTGYNINKGYLQHYIRWQRKFKLAVLPMCIIGWYLNARSMVQQASISRYQNRWVNTYAN